MGLADDLIVTKTAPELCPFGRMRDELNESDRAALDGVTTEILATPTNVRMGTSGGVTIAWLHGALRKNGVRIGRQTINDHLRGVCRCESR